MGLGNRIIAKKIMRKIATSEELKTYDSDPKKSFLMTIDMLIETIQNQGYASDLRKHLKEKHGWIFK